MPVSIDWTEGDIRKHHAARAAAIRAQDRRAVVAARHFPVCAHRLRQSRLRCERDIRRACDVRAEAIGSGAGRDVVIEALHKIIKLVEERRPDQMVLDIARRALALPEKAAPPVADRARTAAIELLTLIDVSPAGEALELASRCFREFVGVAAPIPTAPCKHEWHYYCQKCGATTLEKAAPPVASDLRERATDIVSEYSELYCIEPGEHEFKLASLIENALVAIRAEAKAEGWEDAVKALRNATPNPHQTFWTNWLAANRPSGQGNNT